jgi:hypothetical protein
MEYSRKRKNVTVSEKWKKKDIKIQNLLKRSKKREDGRI